METIVLYKQNSLMEQIHLLLVKLLMRLQLLHWTSARLFADIVATMQSVTCGSFCYELVTIRQNNLPPVADTSASVHEVACSMANERRIVADFRYVYSVDTCNCCRGPRIILCAQVQSYDASGWSNRFFAERWDRKLFFCLKVGRLQQQQSLRCIWVAVIFVY